MRKTKRNYRNEKVADLVSRIQRRANELSRCDTGRTLMHGEQVVSAKLFAFKAGSRDHLGPSVRGDTLSLAPLLDGPVTPVDGFRHFREGVPNFEDIGDRAHGPDNASDELSESSRITYPVTKSRRNRTICPMGRGTTDADFVDDFCRRVRAAREMAGYADRDAFARLMGIEKDTYFRYESRTPLPHRYIPRFLELTGADAQILFTGKRELHQKTG